MSGRERSVAAAQRRYMLGGEPPEWPPAEVPVWQAPLLASPAGSSADDIRARMQRAGALWLQNYDLSFSGALIISCADIDTSYVFCRAAAPDEPYCVIGPVGADLVAGAMEIRRPGGPAFQVREGGGEAGREP